MKLEGSCSRGDEPAALEDYQAFLSIVKKGLEEDSTKEWRSKLIRQIIGKIEVGTDRVKIHWRTGEKWALRAKKSPQIPFFLKKVVRGLYEVVDQISYP